MSKLLERCCRQCLNKLTNIEYEFNGAFVFVPKERFM